jgi:hydroxypyruvate isomerase
MHPAIRLQQSLISLENDMSNQLESTSIRYAANLKWLFTELPFLDRFAAAAEQSFKAVEFASPYEFAPGILRQALQREGLEQVLINTPAAAPGEEGANGFACIPGQQLAFRDGMRRALDYAGELDCRLIHVMAGRVQREERYEAAEATFRENLAWAVDAAKGTGIRCLIECINQVDVPGFFLRNLKQTADFINESGTNQVGLLFDVYHCRMNLGDVIDAYQALQPLIAHIQFADTPGRHEPGTGDIPWAALRELIERCGYKGWVGCEYRPQVSTVAGLGWRAEI